MPARKGRPRKFGTPADLERAIHAYEAKMAEKDEFPSEPGLLLYLGISKSAYRKYCNLEDVVSDKENPTRFSDSDKLKYKEVFENAALVREDWLAKHMAHDGKGANGYMNLLKQSANGGYRDRPKDDDVKTLNINLTGVGGLECFK